MVRTDGVGNAARKVDVVTTGTFGLMCSSGAFLNMGHTKPKMRASRVSLNDVEAYAGIAAEQADTPVVAISAWIGAGLILVILVIGVALKRQRQSQLQAA